MGRAGVIVKIGPNKWVLLSRKTRKIIGTHRSRKDAITQEAAINISKARAAGYRIPRRKY